jgi:hypothetical protein
LKAAVVVPTRRHAILAPLSCHFSGCFRSRASLIRLADFPKPRHSSNHYYLDTGGINYSGDGVEHISP